MRVLALARSLSSTAASAASRTARLAPPAPPAGVAPVPPAIVPAQEYLVSKIVANHLRRPQKPEPRAVDGAADAARGMRVGEASTRVGKASRATKLQSSPDARPPAFEPDTLRVPIAHTDRDKKASGSVESSWPVADFKEMISEMKTTIGRFAGVPRENIRFRVNLVPLSLDAKDCITSAARPNTPPASLIANYISEQIEGGKLRELGSMRGVSALTKEIYDAYGPHTGRRRYVKGVRLLISGRLGQERASDAGATEGTLPLSTIDADVDYATRRAQTRSGMVGIKVWVVNDGVPMMDVSETA
ncbi:hypothetical protein KFE25_000310 [Diacronema lutheri]|uniref:Small ribosomal subunit protein uS3 C-terminal domain-containing protein n=1 Tax=Diacronema lutheri TaxID=2081491 RepID=A0A8J5XHL9_DIALT|nr:hypothetical protein KFE25_010440 [Diacronema lutheri]KAG8464142.1 hypothetical protein KFE25_000310 [Diacronema lutheri]